jgi:hypothetical protein
LPHKRQLLVLGASFTDTMPLCKRIMSSMREPLKLMLCNGSTPALAARHVAAPVHQADRLDVLKSVLTDFKYKRCVVGGIDASSADAVAVVMTARACKTGVLSRATTDHGAVLAEFRSGVCALLLVHDWSDALDALAYADYVVHYNVPPPSIQEYFGVLRPLARFEAHAVSVMLSDSTTQELENQLHSQFSISFEVLTGRSGVVTSPTATTTTSNNTSSNETNRVSSSPSTKPARATTRVAAGAVDYGFDDASGASNDMPVTATTSSSSASSATSTSTSTTSRRIVYIMRGPSGSG